MYQFFFCFACLTMQSTAFKLWSLNETLKEFFPYVKDGNTDRLLVCHWLYYSRFALVLMITRFLKMLLNYKPLRNVIQFSFISVHYVEILRITINILD